MRKILNLHTKISMENWLFTNFLAHLPGLLPFYTTLENNTIFLHQLFRFRVDIPPSPLRAPLIMAVLGVMRWQPTGGNDLCNLKTKHAKYDSLLQNFNIFLSQNYILFKEVYNEELISIFEIYQKMRSHKKIYKLVKEC